MKRKSILFAVFVVLIVALLCACGSSDTTGNQSSNQNGIQSQNKNAVKPDTNYYINNLPLEMFQYKLDGMKYSSSVEELHILHERVSSTSAYAECEVTLKSKDLLRYIRFSMDSENAINGWSPISYSVFEARTEQVYAQYDYNQIERDILNNGLTVDTRDYSQSGGKTYYSCNIVPIEKKYLSIKGSYTAQAKLELKSQLTEMPMSYEWKVTTDKDIKYNWHITGQWDSQTVWATDPVRHYYLTLNIHSADNEVITGSRYVKQDWYDMFNGVYPGYDKSEDIYINDIDLVQMSLTDVCLKFKVPFPDFKSGVARFYPDHATFQFPEGYTGSYGLMDKEVDLLHR